MVRKDEEIKIKFAEIAFKSIITVGIVSEALVLLMANFWKYIREQLTVLEGSIKIKMYNFHPFC